MNFKKSIIVLGMVCLVAVLVFTWGCQNQPTGPEMGAGSLPVSDKARANIVVRARGTVSGGHIYVAVDGNQIADFNLTTSYANYSASTNSSGGITVCFDNDDGEDLDVQIDYIEVDGERRQAEDQSYNTGVWQNSECGGGDGMSEMLHCEGCIGFGDVSGGGGGGGATTTAAATTTASSWWGGGSWWGSTTTTAAATTTTSGGATTTSGGGGSNTIAVRARGTGGGEHIYVTVSGSQIGDFNLTTSYQNYSASTNNTGDIQVCFDNDDGENMDVQIDYITVNGSTRQAEDQQSNTGVWQNSSCGGEYSEMLHCEGCIGFGNVSGGGGSTSTTTTSGGYTSTTTTTSGGGGGSNSFVVRARGTGGGEHIYLSVGDNQVADWNLSTSYQNYSASTNNTGGTLVCFDNDDGENMDVQIDYLEVNGERRQAEDQTYNTGVWQDSECGGGDGHSEMLHCEGCIGFGDVSGGGGSTTTTSGGYTSTTTTTSGGGGGSPNANPSWRVGSKCFEDGGSGQFDDIAVKDPSIVYSGGRYHIFYTGRDNSSWRMGYASASSISGLRNASHTYMSTLNVGSYFCAPQVFYCEAKGQWYLVYQSGQGATYSTNSDVGNPNGWSAGRSMFSGSYLDYWIIREGNTMYIFYAPGDDSRTIKRRSTSVSSFPSGWGGESTVATSTFEGEAVYKNNADGQYYMIVEDINRHYELWRASSPGGNFTKVSEEWAHRNDLIYESDHWTDQVSHGEIIRAGTNEYMEVSNLNSCQFLIQGVPSGSYGEYWQIPYDLGVIRN